MALLVKTRKESSIMAKQPPFPKNPRGRAGYYSPAPGRRSGGGSSGGSGGGCRGKAGAFLLIGLTALGAVGFGLYEGARAIVSIWT